MEIGAGSEFTRRPTTLGAVPPPGGLGLVLLHVILTPWVFA